ncbi:MAG: nucleotidyltransferase family protein [Rubrivivax sp.]|nr:nucleotidyltransferase family protein [Rubrivivax sp.]
MRFRPTIVVLAAGQGSRFRGTPHKLVQALGGSSVLGTTVQHAIASHLPVVLVTTAALVPLVSGQLATRDIVVLSDAESQRGVGYSIAAGVAERAGAQGWLVLPGDMPRVQPATLRAVGALLEMHPVACAQYRGRRGHPVGFAAELYSELIQLTGDEGARRLVARYPAQGLEVDDPGVLIGVDTEADLDALRALEPSDSAEGG